MKEKYKLLRLGRQALITNRTPMCLYQFFSCCSGRRWSFWCRNRNIGSEISSTDAGLAALSEQGYILTHENQALRLYCATSGDHTGTFAVINKADGQIWYSNPLDAADDPVFAENHIDAIVAVYYLSWRRKWYDGNAQQQVRQCRYDGLNLQKLKNGLRFNFTFPAVDITVPFTVLLNDDGSMTAKIAVDAIEERSSYDLFSVSMLPYFCAASDKDKGFALIPDGSGAVMTLNNGKTHIARTASRYTAVMRAKLQNQRLLRRKRSICRCLDCKKTEAPCLRSLQRARRKSTVNAAVSRSGIGL